MVSNMDTTGTIEMAVELQKHKVLTCLHKYYTVEDFKGKPLDSNYYAVSTGIKFLLYIRNEVFSLSYDENFVFASDINTLGATR